MMWRIRGEFLRLLFSLPTRLSFTSGLWMRPSMLTRKPTVGGGAGFSGACGPPSAWLVLRRLPWPRRFLAKAIRGPAPGAPVLEPLHLTPMSSGSWGHHRTSIYILFCLSLSCFIFLSVKPCLEVTVTSLPPLRLCRNAVFSIKPTFSSRTSSSTRSHRLSRVQALQNVARDPLLPFAMQ